MKGPLLSGGARDAVVSYLKANFNSSLLDPDVVRNDGIPLEPISPEHYYIEENMTPLKFPACFVIIGKFAFDYSDGPNFVQGQHDLETVVIAEEVGFENIQRKVESYGRAVFNTLDQKSVTDPAHRFQLKLISKEIEYTNAFEVKASPGVKYYRKAVIYRWMAKHFENRLIP